MPKPIIYLLLLLIIGACSQKLDPKETIVCELKPDDIEGIDLICPEKDLYKLPKFKDLRFYPDTPEEKTGAMVNFPSLLIRKSTYPNKKEISYTDSFTGEIFYKRILGEILPLGPCTLHFIILTPKVRAQIEQSEFEHYSEDDVYVFCREHFDLLLKDMKKRKYPGVYIYLKDENGNYILPPEESKRQIFFGRLGDGIYFPEKMSNNLVQYIKPEEKLYVITPGSLGDPGDYETQVYNSYLKQK